MCRLQLFSFPPGIMRSVVAVGTPGWPLRGLSQPRLARSSRRGPGDAERPLSAFPRGVRSHASVGTRFASRDGATRPRPILAARTDPAGPPTGPWRRARVGQRSCDFPIRSSSPPPSSGAGSRGIASARGAGRAGTATTGRGLAAGRSEGRALPAAAVFLLARRVLGLALTPSMIAECGHLFNSGNRASLFGEGIGNQPPWRPAEGRYIGGGGGWLRTSRPPTSRPDPVCRPFVRPGGTKNEHLQ